MLINKPHTKPSDVRFGSGPVRKPKNWSIESLDLTFLGRSHRAQDGVEFIQNVVSAIRKTLLIPNDYYVGLMVGSATVAMEAALWNLVGTNPLRVLNFDTFSNRWAMDVLKQLKPSIPVCNEMTTFGKIPSFKDENLEEDLLFCYNGSTTGVMVSDLNWVQEKRNGLIFCDATSAAYCIPLPFSKLDITVFSFQKGLGAEAGIGCIVLSPKAYERLNQYEPIWPIPRILRIKDGMNAIFEGKLLNTPSQLCLSEILYCHELFEKKNSFECVQKNKKAFDEALSCSLYFKPIIQDKKYQSFSTGIIVLKERKSPEEEKRIFQKISQYLRDENVAFDILNHAEQPPSIRIWLGPTMEEADIRLLFSWLDFAYQLTI
jgi:phosphoserine aminotransferase